MTINNGTTTMGTRPQTMGERMAATKEANVARDAPARCQAFFAHLRDALAAGECHLVSGIANRRPRGVPADLVLDQVGWREDKPQGVRLGMCDADITRVDILRAVALVEDRARKVDRKDPLALIASSTMGKCLLHQGYITAYTPPCGVRKLISDAWDYEVDERRSYWIFDTRTLLDLVAPGALPSITLTTPFLGATVPEPPPPATPDFVAVRPPEMLDGRLTRIWLELGEAIEDLEKPPEPPRETLREVIIREIVSRGRRAVADDLTDALHSLLHAMIPGDEP